MSLSTRLRAPVDGRRAVLAIGALYVVLALAYPFVVDSAVGTDVVMLVLVGGPGALILAAGAWLGRSELHPGVYWLVAKWCLRGIAAMLGLLGLIAIAAGLRDPLQNLLLLTAIGSVAGLAAGVHDARAKTRELELQETVEELRAANERLSQFTYAASHDLQEPLRMVSSYLQLIETRAADDLDEETREYFEFAIDGADRMRAMVDSLHEYSKVTPSEQPLEETDSGAVLEDALDDLQLRIEETDATVTVDDLPTVTADETQLGHLFRNLLSNALEHSGDEPPRVHVDAERTDEGWQFAVADEGPGIPPEYHDQLFDAFERLQANEGDVGAGGTGLALCERIVERHGGDIWVESEPGEGATFYFTLPPADAAPPELGAEASVVG